MSFVPASKHIQGSLIIRSKERLFTEARHNHLTRRFAANAAERIIICDIVIAHASELTRERGVKAFKFRAMIK